MSDKRIKHMVYFAGFIEASPGQSGTWRDISYKELQHQDLLIYCPVRQEAIKTGKNAIDNCEQIKHYKQGGAFDKFFDIMWNIWAGVIEYKPGMDLISLFVAMRMRKYLDGNRERDLAFMGDWESVIRSDFVLAYLPKNILTVGTHWELFLCVLFRIPVYLVLPDTSRTDANSTMIFGNMLACQGKVNIFYSLPEALTAVKKDYNLN
jgi:hypothetical protein